MLSEAIQQETGMDDNLRVERIEINTDISEQWPNFADDLSQTS